MPIKRLEKARATLPEGYQYGDGLDPKMRALMEQYGGCEHCGRGITLCSAFPCAPRETKRALVRDWIFSVFPPKAELPYTTPLTMPNRFITPKEFRRDILRAAFRAARECHLGKSQRRKLYLAALKQYGF